jgi:hypothetical protein
MQQEFSSNLKKIQDGSDQGSPEGIKSLHLGERSSHALRFGERNSHAPRREATFNS